jgi:hypothetical protein
MKHWQSHLVAALVGTAAAANAAPVARDVPPLGSRCPTARIVDAQFRDGALQALERLLVRAPGRGAHGAVRMHHSPGHFDTSGRAWHLVSAYPANLGMIGALRVSPQVLPAAADWLRWQARHMALAGPTRGVVVDHWVREGDLKVSTCPPGADAGECGHVDAHDSTAASLLLLAEAFARYGGDRSVLRKPTVRRALEAAAAALTDLTRPDGLSWAKPDHRVAYLMDAVEVAAGWRAWAWLQREVYRGGAGGGTGEAPAAAAAARRAEAAIHSQLWDGPSGSWRVSAEAPPLRPGVWYPDTVAQAWPLLWSGGLDDADFERAGRAWRGVARHWQGPAGWSGQNVDPDGFWWPAVAVAARCMGDGASARAWVARARALWLQPASPFAWPFQVSDLLWLLWLAEPTPAAGNAAAHPRPPTP